VEWLQINNGNVGIGTAPGFKLDVAGAANISGDLRVGGNFGIGGAPANWRRHCRGTPCGCPHSAKVPLPAYKSAGMQTFLDELATFPQFSQVTVG
jgi:hypothetical protein